MVPGPAVVTLTPQEMIRLKIIVLDKDKDDAFTLLCELHERIEAGTIRGLKSHIDR